MLAGEVEVDGEVVTRLGTKVDPRTAVIRVAGKRLPPVSDHVYLVLNKPRGVVSTMSDPEGRRDARRRGRRPARAALPRRPARHRHRPGCCCSPTTATSRTGWRTRRTRWTRPTSPRSTGEVTKAPLQTLLDGVDARRRPGHGLAAPGSSHARGRQVDRRAGHPRGPQPDRAAAARPRRPPGAPADPHPVRPGGARAA